jgi:hypothetical protein
MGGKYINIDKISGNQFEVVTQRTGCTFYYRRLILKPKFEIHVDEVHNDVKIRVAVLLAMQH